MKRKILYLFFPLMVGIILGISLSIKLDILPNLRSQSFKTEDISYYSISSLEEAVINVANTVGKAVVSISTEYTKEFPTKKFYFGYPFEGTPFEDDFFRRFFDEFFGELPPRHYKQVALGSGVIINSEGYILTNEHVISGADKITVTLPDGREFKAEIKGKDVRSDLAVIKINATDLPIAPLGNSDELKIGQWVVAIGNPFGFALQTSEPTVTVGVISALHRSLGRTLQRDRDYNDLIQTDAAINPGNSGGPLVNIKGEVIGINVAIFSTTGGYQGIGFAIPINTAKRILKRLIEGKKILYGWLGVSVQNLDEKMVKYFGLREKKGALVAEVLKDSPAQKAGIKEGDVIVRFNNQEIKNIRELINLVSNTEVGKKVKIGIVRDRKEITLEVEIGQRPDNLEEVTEKGREIWRGMEVKEITPEIARELNLEEKSGVVVIDVESNSPADIAGITRGDVILEIEKQPIRNLSDYKRVTQALKGTVAVRTKRGYFIIEE
ncbi:MAG: Do family serine endopeptidase [Candidatus Omnitrophica bacterium]|nr:Do family serine endopeptidase [Candidatus Omnitrophota bacterium]